MGTTLFVLILTLLNPQNGQMQFSVISGHGNLPGCERAAGEIIKDARREGGMPRGAKVACYEAQEGAISW
jgi:hypothetical protein